MTSRRAVVGVVAMVVVVAAVVASITVDNYHVIMDA